jgi:ketosteroid isomerase-like protein
MSKEEDEVRKSSERFYAAMNRMVNGDAGPLADSWSHGAAVTAMHPIGGRVVGWENVRHSFEQVAQVASDGRVKLVDQIVQVTGDVACELGVERGQIKLAGQLVHIDNRVTNIYRRESGSWKVVHHHVDASPAMLEIIGRLQAKT